jgi:hypothetical protein
MPISKSIDSIVEALQRDRHVMAELYCESPSCSAREVTILIKDDDEMLLDSQREFVCPICREPLKFHVVFTRSEHAAAENRDARRSVNTQMFARDQNGETGIPIAISVDDRLPPTPDGWWDYLPNYNRPRK